MREQQRAPRRQRAPPGGAFPGVELAPRAPPGGAFPGVELASPGATSTRRPGMQILNYTDEHAIFRSTLRKFLQKELVPHVEQWEREQIVPRWAWEKMGQQGFLCMDLPEQYGGMEADFLYSVILCEELTRSGCNGLAASLHSDIVVPYISSYADEALKQSYLPGCASGEIITAVAMTEPRRAATWRPCAPRRRRTATATCSTARRPSSATGSTATWWWWRRATRRIRTRTRPSTSTSSTSTPRASTRASRSPRSACTARTPPSSSSPTAASPGRTCSAPRAAASSC